jgi:hypothetical protein
VQIKLINKVPEEDGYYLMKFREGGGVHLVLIQTELDGRRVILPDVYIKKQVIIEIKKGHDDMLKNAFFTEEPFKFVY